MAGFFFAIKVLAKQTNDSLISNIVKKEEIILVLDFGLEINIHERKKLIILFIWVCLGILKFPKGFGGINVTAC